MSKQHEQATEEYSKDEPQIAQTTSQDDDNVPMVHKTPKDYRSWALRYREELQAEGKEVVLMSELPSHVPRRPDEAGADYAKRYSNTMNEMIRRGVKILNDQCTADVAPSLFSFRAHDFDVGPQSGITKKEYREFSQWMGSEEAKTAGYEAVPERFKKFEVDPDSPDNRLRASE